jgi:HK97 family phage prohead protease
MLRKEKKMTTPKDNIQKLINEKSVQFRDFHNVKVETRALEEGDEELVIEGIACVFNTPTVLYSDGDTDYCEQVDARAFEGCDMSDVIFNYNHCGRVFARNRNKTLELEVKEDGLHIKAHLRKGDNGHEELYNDIKSGIIDKMSFAFTVKSNSYDKKSHTRTIEKIDRLFDVSAVDIPAYNTTEISARSFFESERRKEIEEIEKEQRELDLAKAKFFYAQI